MQVYKILMVGEVTTGKTSLINRYVNNNFTYNYRSTIGVCFSLKIIDNVIDNTQSSTVFRNSNDKYINYNNKIKLYIWDVSGNQRFSDLTSLYYKNASAAFVNCDITQQNTFDEVIKWKQELDAVCLIPIILLINKIDLQTIEIIKSDKELDDFCNDNGFITWIKTSSKDNIGIDDAFNKLIKSITVPNNKTIYLDQESDIDHPCYCC